jgi:pilus assembly protein CpaF
LHIPYRVLAGENISARFVVPTVAASVDMVVQIGIDADGKRRVREIVAVPGRVESDVIEAEAVFASEQGRLVRAQGMPPRLDSFAACGIDIHAILAQRGDDGPGPTSWENRPRTLAEA